MIILLGVSNGSLIPSTTRHVVVVAGKYGVTNGVPGTNGVAGTNGVTDGVAGTEGVAGTFGVADGVTGTAGVTTVVGVTVG